MKYLLLLSLAACGFEVHTTGDITVHHKIELATDFFEKYCEAEYPDDKLKQEECVAKLMVDFLKSLESIK
jgi:hypothetical protein